MVYSTELAEGFKTLEKSDLNVSTIRCTVCGYVLNEDATDNKPCEHLKKLAEDMRNEHI